MTDHKPLTPDQLRAADLLGRGLSQAEVADEVGTSTTSIRRLQKRDDFKALVKQTREAVLDENPTVRSVLEQALTATNPRTGTPLWETRLKAAALLMKPDESPDGGGGGGAGVVERIIYANEDE